ncbi:FAD/NAD(P)-binding protein [Maribacter sp. 2-571]|uniref:FAD/NAD(P)-binding protein n=1 Tax=Maribacter sp. 2-571 TaxID=3417569 RepID=UPI003D34FE0F
MKQETIAIIGFGPRGLSALESIFLEAAKTNTLIKILIFEKSGQLGSSWVYGPDQSKSNWLNIAERAVAIWPRRSIVFDDFQIPSFPDFQEWIEYDTDKDDSSLDRFPLRSQMGGYLNERYSGMAKTLLSKGLLEVVQGEVVQVAPKNGAVAICLNDGTTFTTTEAVLTIGHQPTEVDGQLKAWQSYAAQNRHVKLFRDTYPVENILRSGTIKPERNIGIRGFGLAMIDVVRALSQKLGGRFKVIDESTRAMKYLPSGKEADVLVPFSLDGLPMAPKPLNKKIDQNYVPTDSQLEKFRKAVRKSIESDIELKSPEFLMDAIAPLIVEKFSSSRLISRPHNLKNNEIRSLVKSWLLDENFSHPLIVSKKLPVNEMIAFFVGMATGTKAVSLDFCIGHIWRHCQPTMYELLSFAPLSDELIAAIVALDERLKRYSYGPPVDSLQQLLALVAAKRLTLDYIRDPDIETTESGWRLTNKNSSIKVQVMVNSVLDSPELKKVASPIVRRLLEDDKVEALHDDLGIRTEENGSVKFANSEKSYRLSVLGRLAKGTLIGVDAIAECFGERSELWAQGVLSRLREKQ